MAGDMTRVAYVSDNTVTYGIRQDASNAAAVGNVENLTAADPPSRLEPRYALFAHPTTGRERKIVIGSISNPLWTRLDSTTVNLPDFDALMAPVGFILRGRIGEKR
jgi:hypothetical protein